MHRTVKGTHLGWSAALIALAVMLFSLRTRSEARVPRAGVHLSWVRTAPAASCPDASVVQADVVRRLGYDPFSEPSSTSLEVAVSKDEGAWRAEIDVRGTGGAALGSRTVTSEASSCTSLAAAAGLAIALMIDPDALTRFVQPTAPLPAPPVAPLPASTQVPAPEPRRSFGAVPVGPVLASGVLPELALGVQLRAERLIVHRSYATLAGVFLPEQRHTVSDGRVNFGVAWAALGLCQHFPLSSQSGVAACGSLLVGALHSVVLDPLPMRPGERFWIAASAGVAVQWTPWSFLGIQAGADLLAPINRRAYVIERANGAASVGVFEQPALGVLGTAALQVSF